jgi:alpha-glucoside transport system substrate-binding protein
MLGVLGGAELDAFLTIMAPFEEAVGTTVDYEGTRDLGAVLQTRVDGGNPPDLVSTPAIGQIADLARSGEAVDLGTFLDVEQLRADYTQGLLDSATADGKLFGIYDAINVGSLIWHNPKTYDGPTAPATWDELAAWATAKAATGETPWCIGLESGAASGWPGANLINDILIRLSGAEIHDQWWRGELPWTSPEVKRAFETYGTIATDPSMTGGAPDSVVATAFNAAADGIWADPPTCYLHPQANFMGGIITGNNPALVPINDVDFFALPAFDEGNPGMALVSGEIVAMFNDTPQTRALVTYLATPAAQALIAKTGIWMSANKRVGGDQYPNPFTGKAAETVAAAEAVHYYGVSLMPQAMIDAYWKAVLDYTRTPDRLDEILAEVDSVRQTAYE